MTHDGDGANEGRPRQTDSDDDDFTVTTLGHPSAVDTATETLRTKYCPRRQVRSEPLQRLLFIRCIPLSILLLVLFLHLVLRRLRHPVRRNGHCRCISSW